MLTKDIYHRQINPAASEAKLMLIGKSMSWVVVSIMAAVAIYLHSLEDKPTLVKLMNMKFDMLMQLGPGFILGMQWRGMKPSAPFWGLVSGLVLVLALYPVGTLANWGVHAGVFGLALNLAVVIALSKLPLGQARQKVA
jgi:Na+/proline symporter